VYKDTNLCAYIIETVNVNNRDSTYAANMHMSRHSCQQRDQGSISVRDVFLLHIQTASSAYPVYNSVDRSVKLTTRV